MAEIQIDEASVSRFITTCGCHEQQARFLLEACNNNMDAALSMYYGECITCYGSCIAWADNTIPRVHSAVLGHIPGRYSQRPPSMHE